jgi:hypothetical protein
LIINEGILKKLSQAINCCISISRLNSRCIRFRVLGFEGALERVFLENVERYQIIYQLKNCGVKFQPISIK